jgi:hypothetical protein
MSDRAYEENDNDFMSFVAELVRARSSLPPYDKRMFDRATELARDPLRAHYHPKPAPTKAAGSDK